MFISARGCIQGFKSIACHCTLRLSCAICNPHHLAAAAIAAMRALLVLCCAAAFDYKSISVKAPAAYRHARRHRREDSRRSISRMRCIPSTAAREEGLCVLAEMSLTLRASAWKR